MASLFKYARKRSVPQLAADLANLKKDERELKEIIDRNPSNHGAKTALHITQAQMLLISETWKRYTGKHRVRRAGMRRTVKRTKMDRRRRR